MNYNFFFDFDSTLVALETLDELLLLALKKEENNRDKKKKIAEITEQGMSGEIDLKKSLEERLKIADIYKNDIQELNKRLPSEVTPQMPELIAFLQASGHNVFIISGGFLDNILPIAVLLGVPAANVFANSFIKENDKVIGIDLDNPLIFSNGKSKIISQFEREKVICIGDGISDAKPKLNGLAKEFWGFWAHNQRKNIMKMADYNFNSAIEILDHVKNNI